MQQEIWTQPDSCFYTNKSKKEWLNGKYWSYSSSLLDNLILHYIQTALSELDHLILCWVISL